MPESGAPARPPRDTVELALAPLLQRVGAEVVHDEPRAGDVPIQWLGETLFHVRLAAGASSAAPAGSGGSSGAEAAEAAEPTDLTGGLARLIAAVEEELGGPLATLSRPEKQHAVRLLEERGAFEMRRSAETVAEALGLTRFTVYNYLNRVRGAADEAIS
jgi:hypothetical protein